MPAPALGMSGQLASESIADFCKQVQDQLAQIEAEEQRQAEAEGARLQVKAEAGAEKQRLEAAADADAQARRKQAQDLLQRHEAASVDRLKFWHFEPSEGHDDATAEEQHKDFLSKLVTPLVYTCNQLQSELEKQHRELENLRQAVRNHKDLHEDATRALHTRVQDLEQAAPRPDAGEPSNAASARQLEQQLDHVLAMLNDINTFTAPATISEQLNTLKTEIRQLQQPPANDGSTGAPRQYKMPTFRIEKFDDYTQQDAVIRWQSFTTETRIHRVPDYSYISALYLNSNGGCQIWLNHMATIQGVQVANLHTKISWKDLTKECKKRFIVDDASTLAINRLFAMTQGNTLTRDWLTEWQKIVATPDLHLPFSRLRREFYNRSCAALNLALGDHESTRPSPKSSTRLGRSSRPTGRQHMKNLWHSQPMWRKENLVCVRSKSLQSNRTTLWKTRQPPQHHVREIGGRRPAAKQQQTPWKREDLPMPKSRQGGHSNSNQLGKLSRAGGEATPPLTPPDSAALLAASYTSGENADVASPRCTYEDYTVHLVPPLDQPLHVQDSTTRIVSSTSATDSAALPKTFAGDSTSWLKLQELNPLTITNFQWMPLPPTDRLSKPHCNALMAQLREYLHTAVPAPLMDAGVEVVDLRNYLAKIDREFETQRYDNNNAPLLSIRIQIGEATSSALMDCGATRNYMSQDFMVRAGLGPRNRRKSQPMQVTLANGHTHKSIDSCIDSVPVYFAPHASEAVSFDILDTKFDMILGMSWLQSEDHSVNFHRRTVHIHDRNGVLVPCTVLPPHPSISCHVVSAASIRAFITRDDIEEMGLCFLHTLPPYDNPSTDASMDSRITELPDTYGDVFEAPHGVVPDRAIRHEIILEAGAIPPRGCIYRISEEELSVLRAQLNDLLEKGRGHISSPYGAPVLFVRKKNKDWRLCIDYRKLNAQTVKNTGPLPRIDDLLKPLGDTQFFSKLNLKSGYHQLEIRWEDRYKTAFKTRYGHFEWLVMPFGLMNVATMFQAAMTTKFHHMLDRFVLIYLDDILVYSRSLDEHVDHLQTVSERLRQAKYKANRDKLLLHSRGKDLLCAPRDHRLETRFLGEYHDSQLAGHFGVNRTIARLRQQFRWPDLITDVTRYCNSCEVCRRSKPRNCNPYGELRSLPILREPDLSIAMDVTDYFGHNDILTVVDRLSTRDFFLASTTRRLPSLTDSCTPAGFAATAFGKTSLATMTLTSCRHFGLLL
ncbi:hypothetical protein CBR_g8470 [Chara braunii]|uniref:Reverse transcriptase domain-containing protein n=1 Tax=Chara braunii TaxID=69332 RepID=A0A388KME6_CHABU|nr:hypothetical protein CBR_g8470 [Chara braunii]|eukprot:GBG71168.1 hypothetical protein CBR_g8470 [Chara braunii]